GAIASELGEKASRDGGAPLTVVTGRPRPDGWAGKVWAMAQGFTVAAAAAPEYVLFTDADISWAPLALRDLVAGAETDDRALVSQMALLRAQTRWERVIVPAFVYFFAQLYPFRKVNDPKSGTAAAAGGCMLVRRSALEEVGGLEPISGALIDDVALGTLLKKHGDRTWLSLTTDISSARPYPSLASLWHMIARSAYVQLRYNPLLLAGTIAGLLLLYVAPPAGVIAGLVVAAAGGCGRACGLGADDRQLRPDAPPVPAVGAPRAIASADRPAVRRDDRRLGAASLLGPGRFLARSRSRTRVAQPGAYSAARAGTPHPKRVASSGRRRGTILTCPTGLRIPSARPRRPEACAPGWPG